MGKLKIGLFLILGLFGGSAYPRNSTPWLFILGPDMPVYDEIIALKTNAEQNGYKVELIEFSNGTTAPDYGPLIDTVNRLQSSYGSLNIFLLTHSTIDYSKTYDALTRLAQHYSPTRELVGQIHGASGRNPTNFFNMSCHAERSLGLFSSAMQPGDMFFSASSSGSLTSIEDIQRWLIKLNEKITPDYIPQSPFEIASYFISHGYQESSDKPLYYTKGVGTFRPWISMQERIEKNAVQHRFSEEEIKLLQEKLLLNERVKRAFDLIQTATESKIADGTVIDIEKELDSIVELDSEFRNEALLIEYFLQSKKYGFTSDEKVLAEFQLIEAIKNSDAKLLEQSLSKFPELANKQMAIQNQQFESRSPEGYYADLLSFAVIRHASAQTAEVLLKYLGANGNYEQSGLAPLFFAAQWGANDILKLLLKKGVNPNLVEKYPESIADGGFSALLYAAQSANDEGVDLLIENHADIHYRTKEGKDALFAAVYGRPDDIEDLNQYYLFGYTEEDWEKYREDLNVSSVLNIVISLKRAGIQLHTPSSLFQSLLFQACRRGGEALSMGLVEVYPDLPNVEAAYLKKFQDCATKKLFSPSSLDKIALWVDPKK